MSTPRQTILHLAEKVHEDSNLTIKCPFCCEDYENQGRPAAWKPERSMSITREGYALLYNCFRAGCSRGRGVVHILDGLHRASLAQKEKQSKKFIPKWYKYRTVPAKTENLPRKITLTQKELQEQHVRYAPDRGTVVFPIFDEVQHEVGVVDRSFSGRKPKAISYWFVDVPKIHFPLSEIQTDACFVVEDVPSAIRASTYMSSVALLGTNITSDCLMLLKNKYNVLYIALDEDATLKAIQMAKKYSLFFKEVRAVPLERDLKETGNKKLEELFGGLV